VPLGTALVPVGFTAIVTTNPWAVVMLEEDGDTITAGVVFGTAVTVTGLDPDAPL
jgi:hypothetical protein